MLLNFGSEKDSIRLLLENAQRGDDAARETIISTHQVFIKRMVAKSLGTYEAIDNRDEYAVGLIALNEAIDSYKPGLLSFRAFAARVIKRRIIDYIRSQKNYRNQVLFMNDEYQVSIPDPGLEPEDKINMKIEMESFVKRLARCGIDLADLIKATPKHIDSKRLCLKIAWQVYTEPEFVSHFNKYYTLPVKKLVDKLNINPKTIERHRKYIIAMCLILLSDLEQMKSFIVELYKGGEKDGQ